MGFILFYQGIVFKAKCLPFWFLSLYLFLLKKYKMHIDRNTGIIEMFMEKLQDEDEGTYTFQIQDGKATGHSTLVLIGDGKSSEGQSVNTWLLISMQMPHGLKEILWLASGTVWWILSQITKSSQYFP